MKNFTQYVSENFTIARDNMPQLQNVDDFLSYLSSMDVGYSVEYGYVDALKPTQAEGFNKYKINNVAMAIRKDPDSVPGMKPIITSEDGYIVDGHHRAMAAAKEQAKFPYIVVDTTSNKLLKMAYEYLSSD